MPRNEPAVKSKPNRRVAQGLLITMLVLFVANAAADVSQACTSIIAPAWAPVGCFKSYIDFSRGPHFVVEMFDRSHSGRPQPLHKVSFYSHYEKGAVEPILAPDGSTRMMSVVIGGIHGSGIEHRLWVLYGYPGGNCRPYWVDNDYYRLGMPSEQDELKIKRHVISGKNGLRINLAYTWIKHVDEHAHVHKTWKEQLVWNEKRHSFDVKRASGDGGAVQRNIQAYRRKIKELRCEDLERLADDQRLDLGGIFSR